MSSRRKKMLNKEADRRFQERQEAERRAWLEAHPPRPVGPVRIEETGGVTAEQLWRLCRDRECVVIGAPDKWLRARLLCLGYALTWGRWASGYSCALCVPPEGSQDSRYDFFSLGKESDGFSFWADCPLGEMTEHGRARILVEFGMRVWDHSWPEYMGLQEEKFGLAGERPGELISGDGFQMESVETGLVRLEDFSPEEQASIRAEAAVEVKPSRDLGYYRFNTGVWAEMERRAKELQRAAEAAAAEDDV